MRSPMNWVSQGFFWPVPPRFSVGCAFQNAHLLLSDFVDIRSTRPHTHMCACVCRGVGVLIRLLFLIPNRQMKIVLDSVVTVVAADPGWYRDDILNSNSAASVE